MPVTHEWTTTEEISFPCDCCGVNVTCCPNPVPRRLLVGMTFAGLNGGCVCTIPDFVIDYVERPLGGGGLCQFWWGEASCRNGDCEFYVRVRLSCGDFVGDPVDECGTPSADPTCCPEDCTGVAAPWALSAYVIVRDVAPGGCAAVVGADPFSPDSTFVCCGNLADCDPFQFPADGQPLCSLGLGTAGVPPRTCDVTLIVTEVPA